MFQSLPTTKLHISHILTSSHLDQPPDRQGRLFKKSNRATCYQPCWCELRGNLLFCWEPYTDRTPPQLIVLEGCTVELRESSSEPHTFEICYPGDLPDHSYKMAAEDQDTMEDWVRALSTAGFGYLRALTSELEGQFERLKSQQHLQVEEEQRHKAGHLPWPVPKLKVDGRPPRTEFAHLHQKFGEEITKARQQWQERMGAQGQENDSLIYFE